MADLSIGELARRTGLNPSAIRYYERRRLIAEPPRRGGRRCYDADTVARLRLVHAARRSGLSVAEIAALLDGARSRAQFQARLDDAACEVRARIARLQRLESFLRDAAHCGCAAPLRCELAAGIEPTGT